MRVRHLVAAADVTTHGQVADPARVRHGTLRGGHVAALAGPIDLLTHCNTDFAAHRCDACVVVARLEVDAPVVWAGDGFATAVVAAAAFAARGRVDPGGRHAAWNGAVVRTR